RREAIAGFAGNSPGSNVCGAECPELPETLVVDVPSRMFVCDRSRKPRTQRVTNLLSGAALEGRLSAVQAQIVQIKSSSTCRGACCVYTPETDCMIRRIVEETRFVEVRAEGKSVDLPGMYFGL